MPSLSSRPAVPCPGGGHSWEVHPAQELWRGQGRSAGARKPLGPSGRPDRLVSPHHSRHNDLPWQLLDMFNNRLQDERANLSTLAGTHTNIPKLRAGFVGGQVPPALPRVTPPPVSGLAPAVLSLQGPSAPHALERAATQAEGGLPGGTEGRAGAWLQQLPFWSVYTPCDTQNKDAVRRTLEQIDVVQRMCQMYPDTFLCVTSSEDIGCPHPCTPCTPPPSRRQAPTPPHLAIPTGIRNAFQEGKVASLIGVEGGHSIDSSLGVLRALYQLGMRYLTLTHSCNTPWCAMPHRRPLGYGREWGRSLPATLLSPSPLPGPSVASPVGADNWLVDTGDSDAHSQGLSPFGQRVVKELNRLGVMIDLAHVSVATMKDVLRLSRAPVIFSHSSAYSLCTSRRNVPDDVLQLVKERASLVMVNFYNNYVSCTNEATLFQVAGR
ncbi:hypothetical protein P7K49_037050 [Saguinus oedipus]|uniref:Dipeptidase n=1 Tax=Saguinus oedipus TaxID=9490 RepID=A0ABQ9TML2_SAGOE|nr:hypothetical protein P7K49_037050 [Saguinus oedipus]